MGFWRVIRVTPNLFEDQTNQVIFGDTNLPAYFWIDFGDSNCVFEGWFAWLQIILRVRRAKIFWWHQLAGLFLDRFRWLQMRFWRVIRVTPNHFEGQTNQDILVTPTCRLIFGSIRWLQMRFWRVIRVIPNHFEGQTNQLLWWHQLAGIFCDWYMYR